jgi:hypothetical protein
MGEFLSPSSGHDLRLLGFWGLGMGGCFASSVTGKDVVDNIILNPQYP